MKRLLTAAGVIAVSSVLTAVGGQLTVKFKPGEELLAENKTGSELKVPGVEPTDERIRGLKVPSGFRIDKFADGLGKPRMFAVGSDGTLYVTRRETGDVLALRDADGDGKAEDRGTLVKDLPGVHGITIHDGKMYLCTVRELYVGDLVDGKLGKLTKLIDDLPEGGRHPNRTLGFGPDGMLYITVGSTCNCCIEPNRESATVLRAKPDGSERTVFARGLRNTIGFGWHPKTQEMWGMDHGSDWLGDDTPPEELNLLREGKDYGWPFVYADRQVIPLAGRVDANELQKYAASTEPPVLVYQAHSSPLQMVFYTGDQFPAEYRNDAFICMRGSWNRKPPAGYEVVRIHFDDNGKPERFEPFVTGFLVDGPSHFGRLAGIAVARDGSLLVGDDTHGVIYRVSFDGGKGK